MVRFPAEVRCFSCLHSNRGVRLTTYRHLMSRLIMSGAILPPTYAFMAGVGATECLGTAGVPVLGDRWIWGASITITDN